MKYKDSIYRGQVDDFDSKRRSGNGIIVYNNKRVYEG